MSNTENENRFEELASFVAQQVGRYDVSITRATLIEDDLGVAGGDADDLIVAFSKRYNVDIADFNFAKYLYDEPGIFSLENRIVKPFTVGHLEKAIIAARLDDEVINSRE